MKKIVSSFIVLVLVLTTLNISLSLATTDNRLKTKQDKLTTLQKTLNSVNKLVKQLSTKEKSLLKEINTIDKDIERREKDIAYLESRLAYLEGENQKTEEEIKNINSKIEEISDKIKKRLIYLDRLNRGGLLTLFLQGGHSLTDFSRYMFDFGFLMSYDKELLIKNKNQQMELQTKKSGLEKIVEETTALKQDIALKKEELAKSVARKENILQQVQSEKEDYSKKAKELQAQIDKEAKEIQSLLKKLEAERKGKAIGRAGEGFIWPLYGRITSPFGVYRRHLGKHIGLDIAAPTGSPIYASRSGEVVLTGWRAFYGLMVLVYHGNGVATRYAHLSKILVKKGQLVKRGQIIGLCGSTGYSTGPHLHFEIIIGGVHVDPQRYLP
ncbi:MAG: Murein DD-endopeptidase MepM [candidate division WS2 bacterium]|nr:Murein DD-endopeptidase MepM [Candidatus Lithacetigena glycinireducens]